MSTPDTPAKTDNLNRYLSFTLGTESYAVPLLSVREVIAMPEVTPVPYTPPYFLGIMNLRGQVISIMDLRQKLSIKPAASSETSVIICDLNPICIGIVVDSIHAVLAPTPEELSETPDIHSNKKTDYITAVCRRDNNLVLFLDIARTLDVQDHLAISKNSEKKAA